ncbi:uncharacterized protein LOC122394162 isoform X3 [Amphibalanus amphitrite]|uniref:uncharacterized protein LOC122394162 isoform X3 n=1 Tax=Amphibalanus amphitrite TaxID=1232801 RepID=UPI001C92505B|nr:uncharacterized protein LOC122394162 isoform X3 [Amphibalanus amphitrite]
MGTFCCLPSALWWHLKSSRMRTFFALACLVAAASAAPQLADSYLPPDPEPTYPRGSSTCLPVQDVYKTKIVSVPVNKVEESSRQVVVPETKYFTSTTVVPSLISRQVINTQIVPVTQIKVVRSTFERTQLKTITVPGPDQVIRTTIVKYVPVVKTVYVTSTQDVVRTVPKIDVKLVSSTLIQQSTVRVPQISTETNTVRQQLPDNVRTTVKYLTDIVYVTETLPAKTIQRTVVKTETKTVISSVQQPARTVYVDRTQVSTVIRPVTKTELVPQVVTEVKVNYITKVVPAFITSEVVVPSTKIERKVVPVTSYLTSVVQLPVTETVLKTAVVTSVQPGPGKTVLRTVVKTVINTKLVPGATSTIVKNVTKVNTINRVSTVIKDQISSVYKTKIVKESCSGYNYDKPRNPLLF